MQMFLVTGDTHGSIRCYMMEIHPHLKAGDYLFVTGDFGVGFWGGDDEAEEEFYDWLALQKYTVVFVDGNHDSQDRLLLRPLEKWMGGKANIIRHNVIHMRRGDVYTIEGKTFFGFGGGYSIDRMFRVPHVSWWEREMPVRSEYDNAYDKLKQVDFKVDYILTHTAPSETVEYLSHYQDLGIKKNPGGEMPLNAFLDHMQQILTYRKWYFGHFHTDRELFRNQICVYNSLRELESGNIIHQWSEEE